MNSLSMKITENEVLAQADMIVDEIEKIYSFESKADIEEYIEQLTDAVQALKAIVDNYDEVLSLADE